MRNLSALLIPDCHVITKSSQEIQPTFLQFSQYEYQGAAVHHKATGLSRCIYRALCDILFAFAFRFALNFVTEEVINPKRYVNLGGSDGITMSILTLV